MWHLLSADMWKGIAPMWKIVYTRKTDVFIPLMERANIANRNKRQTFYFYPYERFAGRKNSQRLWNLYVGYASGGG